MFQTLGQNWYEENLSEPQPIYKNKDENLKVMVELGC